MSAADWIVLGVVALFAVYGLTNGLIRGALSLAGFAFGAYLGARVAPMLLTDGSPYAPLFALGGALLGGTALRALAGMLGDTLRSTIGLVPGLRLLDKIAGLVLGAAAGIALCWAVGAVLLYLPGQSDLRRAVQSSAILSRINESFPPERLLETIERVDPLGVLVGPEAIVPPPDVGIARDPDIRRASASVVRIRGIACGLGVEGSGWIVRPGLVVTNAHVVAGVSRPRVDRGGGHRALLGRRRGAPVLARAIRPPEGGAVLGHPLADQRPVPAGAAARDDRARRPAGRARRPGGGRAAARRRDRP